MHYSLGEGAGDDRTDRYVPCLPRLWVLRPFSGKSCIKLWDRFGEKILFCR